MHLQLFADTAQERTEEPSQRRLQEARERGQIAKSADLAAGVGMVSAAFALRWVGPLAYQRLVVLLTQRFEQLSRQDMSIERVVTVFQDSAYTFAMVVAPLVLILMVIGVVSGMAQSGLLFSGGLLKPRFDRLNPIAGLGRMFSAQTVTDLLKNIAKVAVLGYVTYLNLTRHMDSLPNLMEQPLPGALTYLGTALTTLLMQVGFGLLAIGIVDYGYQWWTIRKQLMMTKQEVRQEMQQQEGRPEIKSKVRQRQREMAQRRKSLKNVPQATVVITNPTHFAIAIRFNMGADQAPIVVSKGMDILAQRIKIVAKKHNIPMVENRPLARALYKSVEIGDHVPEELYQAVAEVLSFVFRLKRETR